MSDPATPAPSPVLDAIVVGAGFSGLCMAIRLRQSQRSFVVLEQAASLGGTWRDNRYPGAACDVPSNLYCFSFAPNPDWSRRYPRQGEIQAYLENCADRFGVRGDLRFGHAVQDARFEVSTGTWVVQAGAGAVFRARCLVIATGGLSQPRLPDIPGLDTFGGRFFHSARWPEDAGIAGSRVGVIGTGASAIQIVPHLAAQAGALRVFQRTPSWIVPIRDPAVPDWRRRAYRRFPWLQRLARRLVQARLELSAFAFTRAPWLLRAAGPVVALHRRRQLRDAALRKAFTPDYVFGCKRVLLSNDFYPAFDRGRATLVTSPITRVLADGIETADGQRHALDVIVACTGFHAAEASVPFPVRGLGGIELDGAWRPAATAYRGTQVSGFPNLFLMSGPNTGLGHTSVLLMFEAQADYVMALMSALDQHPGRALVVRPEAQAAYNTRLQRRLAGTVWNTGGCRSWYLTRDGRNTTLWPASTPAFRRMLGRVDSQAIDFIGKEKIIADP